MFVGPVYVLTAPKRRTPVVVVGLPSFLRPPLLDVPSSIIGLLIITSNPWVSIVAPPVWTRARIPAPNQLPPPAVAFNVPPPKLNVADVPAPFTMAPAASVPPVFRLYVPTLPPPRASRNASAFTVP